MAASPKVVVISDSKVVNVAAVAHLSPFRYPGGKTWLVPRVRQWLRNANLSAREFAEPFAGGAIVALSALFEKLVQKITLVEKDDDVAAVWKVIVYGEGSRLAQRIVEFELTIDSAKAILAKEASSEFERAFATILRNRVQRGGILAPGASMLKRGENDKGILSRWYPQTLQNRIDAIVRKRDDIAFMHGDGIEFIRQNACRPDTAFFIDPPYTKAGRRLYSHSEVDHSELFRVARTIRGDFLMTYDNSDEIRALARRHGFQTALIPMKTTHHAVVKELLVGRNLDWIKR